MKFTELEVPGAFVLEAEVVDDERGYYARCWRAEEFRGRGLPVEFAQWNLSFTRKRGTLRGLHWQVVPDEEAKVILCTRGRIFDVVVDTRPASDTCGRWSGVTISAADHRMVYVPPGCAHGMLTLEGDSEIFYSSTGSYNRESERGLRYDDEAIGIAWPEEICVISEKDLKWPQFVRPPAAAAPKG